jgi:hypothetical protein
MVAARNFERVGDQSRNGVSAFAVVKPAILIAGSKEVRLQMPAHFDCRHWGWAQKLRPTVGLFWLLGVVLAFASFAGAACTVE